MTGTATQLNRTAMQTTITAIQLSGMAIQTTGTAMQLNRMAMQTTETAIQLNQTKIQTAETVTQTAIKPTQFYNTSNQKIKTHSQTNSPTPHPPKSSHQLATVQAHFIFSPPHNPTQKNEKSLHHPHPPSPPTNSRQPITLTNQPSQQSRIRQHRFCASAGETLNL